MRALLLCWLVLLSCATVRAQTAGMTFEGDGGREPMPLAAVDVSVRLVGTIAETTLTLKFQNPTDRMLEGEFVMPLPEGATVSSYALEVKGAMREAVSVEKERARTAYETIKRKMIDPGLVEREAGNRYRTRVFPVEANLTKEMRIGYVESLKMVDGALRYQLPLSFPGKVGEFGCRVRVDGEGEVQMEALKGVEFRDGVAKGRDVSIEGDLVVRWKPKPDKAEVYGDGSYHWISGIVPANTKRASRPAPKVIDLFWDASDSAREMSAGKVVELLGAYFDSVENTTVRLRFVRNVCSEPKEFQVKDGEWDALKSALETVFYDGATNFDTVGDADSQFSIFVTDGYQTSLAESGVCLVAGGKALTKNELRELRSRSVQPVEMRLDDAVKEGLRELLFSPLSVEMAGQDASDLVDFSGVAGDPFRIYRNGVVSGRPQVLVKSQNEILSRMRSEPGAKDAGLARRLWAQAWLEKLECVRVRDASEIVAFAKEHKLVSDYTSLIVLERFEDYVRFEIPPPEDDLREKYERALAENARALKSSAMRYSWIELLNWHERDFPWADLALVWKLHHYDIWRRASEKVFAPEERDGATFERAEEWMERAYKLTQNKDAIKTKADFESWSVEISKAFGEETVLRNAVSETFEEKLTVSVAGLVKTAGKVSAEGPLSLKDAIRKAGGIRAPGSGARVSVYRLGEKVTYNLLSKEYEPVYLRPGDMVVVRPNVDSYADYADDPFSASGESSGGSDADQPAIVEEQGRSFRGDPFGGSPGVTMDAGVSGTVRENVAMPDLGDFEEALAKKGDAQRLYEELKGSAELSDDLYVEVARILGAKGHGALQEQVLSNVLESNDSEAAVRRYAMWMAEFGRVDDAVKSLTPLKTDAARMDLARLLVRKGAAARGIQIYDQLALDKKDTGNEMAMQALIESNGFLARFPKGEWAQEMEALDQVYRRNVDVDVRIVISSDRPIVVSIDEPGNIWFKIETGVSECGGYLRQIDAGHWVYMMRRGLPGDYRVSVRSKGGPATVQIGYFTHWGKENQTEVWETLLTGDDERVERSFTKEFSE